MTRAIMIQGAGSNVGKSLIVAGLCRHFTNAGLRVRPFKPQNMSNNAAVTADGGEIGRAQALQARACRVDPHTDMNPVLLKPETDTGAQVIVQGKRLATLKARDYGAMKAQLLPPVLQSYRRLAQGADLIIIEGAGSPAEINLRQGDIANMGFAEAADVPVVLIGDIDRGGVIAQIVGTHVVLDTPDRTRIAGFAINKFRGDPTLFAAGLQEIVTRTQWPSLGVLPWFPAAARLPAEDVMDIASSHTGPFKIAVPRLSRMANFDDLDPLKMEPGVSVEIVPPGQPLPHDASLIVIPGSKSTIGDLAYLRAQGWDIDIMAHARRGTHVLGLCGGYQMLGRTIADPEGIEGPPCTVAGLGLLDVTTVMRPQKRLAISTAQDKATGLAVSGYEIHIGETQGPDCKAAWLTLDGRDEGAASPDGRVRGTYLHGLFSEDAFRAAYLAGVGAASSGLNYHSDVEATLDALAAHIAAHLDTELLLRLARALP